MYDFVKNVANTKYVKREFADQDTYMSASNGHRRNEGAISVSLETLNELCDISIDKLDITIPGVEQTKNKDQEIVDQIGVE